MADRRHSHRAPTKPAGPLARITAAAALLAAIAVLVSFQETIRHWEASFAADWLNLIVPGGMHAVGAGFMLFQSPSGPVEFFITTGCTIIVLVVPMFLLAVALLIGRRTRPGRVLLAAVACTVGLVLVSQLRYAIITFATQWAGLNPGFEIAHVFVGSVIAILGFAACAILLIRVGTAGGRAAS